jgi:hypothetical protein
MSWFETGMSNDDFQIWHRLRNESEKRYKAFQYYLRAEHPRDLMLIYEEYKSVERENAVNYAGFRQWYKLYDWFRRASAYDLKMDEIRARVDEQARIKERADRRRILNLLKAKIEKSFVEFSPANPTEMRTLAQIVTAYAEQSRKEYGDYVEAQIASPRLDQIFDVQEELNGARQFLESLVREAASGRTTDRVLELSDGKTDDSDQVRLVILGETVPSASG